MTLPPPHTVTIITRQNKDSIIITAVVKIILIILIVMVTGVRCKSKYLKPRYLSSKECSSDRAN